MASNDLMATKHYMSGSNRAGQGCNVCPAMSLLRPSSFLARPDVLFAPVIAPAIIAAPKRCQARCEFRQNPGSLMDYPA